MPSASLEALIKDATKIQDQDDSRIGMRAQSIDNEDERRTSQESIPLMLHFGLWTHELKT